MTLRTQLIWLICLAIVIGCMVGCALPPTSRELSRLHGEKWERGRTVMELAADLDAVLAREKELGRVGKYDYPLRYLVWSLSSEQVYDPEVDPIPVGQVRIESPFEDYNILFDVDDNGRLSNSQLEPNPDNKIVRQKTKEEADADLEATMQRVKEMQQ